MSNLTSLIRVQLDRITELEAQLEAAKNQWQLIETAPKDGTEIVGAEWQQVSGYEPELQTSLTTYYAESWHYVSGSVWAPTYWMQKPPAIQEGGV